MSCDTSGVWAFKSFGACAKALFYPLCIPLPLHKNALKSDRVRNRLSPILKYSSANSLLKTHFSILFYP